MLKILKLKKSNILNVIIHDSKTLETKYPKSSHVYILEGEYIKITQSLLYNNAIHI